MVALFAATLWSFSQTVLYLIIIVKLNDYDTCNSEM